MNKIRMLIVDGKEVYYLGHYPVLSGDRCKARLRNKSGQWETFEGTVRTGAELGIGEETSYADELWLSIPDFDDFRISYLHGSAVEIARI